MSSPFSRKKKLRLFLALLAVLLFAGAWFVLRDEPPHEDADLRNYRRAVKDEENGFQLLEAVLDDVDWPEDGEDMEFVFAQSKTFDPKKAAEIATENASVFKRLDRCLAMPDLQAPTERLEDSGLAGEGVFRLYCALASRSRLRVEEGKPEEAYEDAMRLVRLGGRLQRAQGPLTAYLRGLAIQAVGIGRLIEMAVRNELPPRLLERGPKDLLPEFHRDALRDALEAEYVALSIDLDQWAAGTIMLLGHSRVFFKHNETKRMLAERIRSLIEQSGAPFVDREQLVPLSDPNLAEVFFLREAGRKFLAFILSSYEDYLKVANLHEVQWSAARALLAIRSHEAGNGALPQSLQALVPEYLEVVPVDPFDGKELRYSASKRIIYSVGSDGADSGGSAEEGALTALADTKEPTLRFDPAAWKLDHE